MGFASLLAVLLLTIVWIVKGTPFQISDKLRIVSTESSAEAHGGFTFAVSYAAESKPNVWWSLEKTRLLPVLPENAITMENVFEGNSGRANLELRSFTETSIYCILTEASGDFYVKVPIRRNSSACELSMFNISASPGLSINTGGESQSLTFTNTGSSSMMFARHETSNLAYNKRARKFKMVTQNNSESQSSTFAIPGSVRGVVSFQLLLRTREESMCSSRYMCSYHVYVSLHPPGSSDPYPFDEIEIKGMRTQYRCSNKRPCGIVCMARGNHISSINLLKGDLNLSVERVDVGAVGGIIKLKHIATGTFRLPSGNATSGWYLCRAVGPGHYRDSVRLSRVTIST